MSLQCDEAELLKIAGVKTQKVKDLIHEKLRHQKTTNSPDRKKKTTKKASVTKTPTKTPGKKKPLAFKSPAISRLTGGGNTTSVVASPVNFNFKPLRVSLSPGAVEEDVEEQVTLEQKEDETEVKNKHIDSIACFEAFLKEYPNGNDGAGNDLLDLAKDSIESLTSSTKNEFSKVCIAVANLNDAAFAAATSSQGTNEEDKDEKTTEWRLKLKDFLWHSVGVMQTMFSMSELAKMSSVDSLVAVLSFTLKVLVHLRKTCDEKQGKWYEIRSRCNLLTIHAAQHAFRATTYVALFELYGRVIRGELIRDSEHVLQRLLRKIKSHDKASGEIFKLDNTFCKDIVTVSCKISNMVEELVEWESVRNTVQDVLKSFCTSNLDMMTKAVSSLETSDKVRVLVEEFGKDKENSTKDAKRSVLQTELSVIFKKISAGISKESTREALEELHDFKSKHPEMDIEKSLKCSGASTIFQQYIFRELKKMDEKARGVSGESNNDLNSRLQKLRARFMGGTDSTASVVKKDTTNLTQSSSPLKRSKTSPSRLRAPKIHSPERKGNDLESSSSGRSLASLRERLRNMKSSSSGTLRKPSPPKPKSSTSLSGGRSDSSSSLDAMKAKLARLKNMATE